MIKKHVILIVDDDTDDREIIRDAFLRNHKDHHEYVFIENGDRLIEHLVDAVNGSMPSLIMLDLNMPGKDGREVLKEIKTNEQFRHIPVIVFTTSGSQKDKEAAYQLGANCFITKPDSYNKLLELLNAVTLIWMPEKA